MHGFGQGIWIANFSWHQNERSLRSLLRRAEPVPRSAINGRPLESIMQAPQKHKSRGTLGIDVCVVCVVCVCGVCVVVVVVVVAVVDVVVVVVDDALTV